MRDRTRWWLAMSWPYVLLLCLWMLATLASGTAESTNSVEDSWSKSAKSVVVVRRRKGEAIGDSDEEEEEEVSKMEKEGVVIKTKSMPARVTLKLQGRWREKKEKRTGLYDMLYNMGMPWWRRFYVVSTSWENEQTIFQNGHSFRINGYKGPQMEVYSYSLVADNTTEALVSLSDLGLTSSDGGSGWLRATALLEGEGGSQALVATLIDQETEEAKALMRWTRRKGSSLMVHETEHLASSTVLRSYYVKQ